MELAGLSVATAVHDFVSTLAVSCVGERKNILVICGPGNNGGDGLVAARHLAHFGHNVTVAYPKQGKGQLFSNLVQQCSNMRIPINTNADDLSTYDLIVDAIFGFSFEGPIREPFNNLIASLASSQIPVISVDVPSGWHVDHGDVFLTSFVPAAVVSLTAPKKCMVDYDGMHYLGGR